MGFERQSNAFALHRRIALDQREVDALLDLEVCIEGVLELVQGGASTLERPLSRGLIDALRQVVQATVALPALVLVTAIETFVGLVRWHQSCTLPPCDAGFYDRGHVGALDSVFPGRGPSPMRGYAPHWMRHVAAPGASLKSPINGAGRVLRMLGPERIERLRPHLKIRQFEQGDYLYHAMQPAEFIWAVRRGEIRTIRSTVNGRVTTLELLRPGDLLGMEAITQVEDYAESAEALSDGEAWGLPGRVATAMLETDPELSRALVGIVAQRLQAAHERLCSFAHERVPERIARTLLDSVGSPRILTTRRQLAESAGTTVETAIRVLRRFEKEGWIEGGVGWIEVTQPDALERITAGDPY